MLGGGMRQVGILAAGALYALEHHRSRLAEDHASARRLAAALDGVCGARTPSARVQTNIVMIDLERGAADDVAARAAQAGVRVGSVGPKRLRAVTHLDVTAGDIELAAERLKTVLKAGS
jgi:threonine aldolase